MEDEKKFLQGFRNSKNIIYYMYKIICSFDFEEKNRFLTDGGSTCRPLTDFVYIYYLNRIRI